MAQPNAQTGATGYPANAPAITHLVDAACAAPLRLEVGAPEQALVACLNLLDRKLITPCTQSAFRIVMLCNSQRCRVINQWFAKYESARGTHLCMTWKNVQVKFKHMGSPTQKPKWLAQVGPWELVFLDSGTLLVAMGVNPAQFTAAMSRLSRQFTTAMSRLSHRA